MRQRVGSAWGVLRYRPAVHPAASSFLHAQGLLSKNPAGELASPSSGRHPPGQAWPAEVWLVPPSSSSFFTRSRLAFLLLVPCGGRTGSRASWILSGIPSPPRGSACLQYLLWQKTSKFIIVSLLQWDQWFWGTFYILAGSGTSYHYLIFLLSSLLAFLKILFFQKISYFLFQHQVLLG